MVGNEFEESGFAPLAIAIHVMYFGTREELRVHHFVSESNESISDPARKFEEAMKNTMSMMPTKSMRIIETGSESGL